MQYVDIICPNRRCGRRSRVDADIKLCPDCKALCAAEPKRQPTPRQQVARVIASVIAATEGDVLAGLDATPRGAPVGTFRSGGVEYVMPARFSLGGKTGASVVTVVRVRELISAAAAKHVLAKEKANEWKPLPRLDTSSAAARARAISHMRGEPLYISQLRVAGELSR
jgi:hypothetical protein